MSHVHTTRLGVAFILLVNLRLRDILVATINKKGATRHRGSACFFVNRTVVEDAAVYVEHNPSAADDYALMPVAGEVFYGVDFRILSFMSRGNSVPSIARSKLSDQYGEPGAK